MNKNILITSAGQRVSLVKFFKQELKKLFPDAHVFTVDMNPKLAPACHISDGYREVNKVTDEDYLNELLQICKKWKIKLVIPTIDTELMILSQVKNQFQKEGIELIVSNESFVQVCRDKRLMNDFFTIHGIDIPRQIDKNNLSFPLFIKPYDGSLSKDIFVIRDEGELNGYHLTNEKLMFMEYMDPSEYIEYTVDTYYNINNNLTCAVPRKRIFVRSGEINKGVTHHNAILPFLKEKLHHIPGAIGCLTMQFFLGTSNNRIVGIEINPRFGGGYPLSFLAGANFPLMLIKEYYLNQPVEYCEDWEDNLLMLRYDDEILVHNYEG